jgi:hypothetical protein
MHISPEKLRSNAHRTTLYGSAWVLGFQANCTILEKSPQDM